MRPVHIFFFIFLLNWYWKRRKRITKSVWEREGKREQPPENVSSALLYQIQTIYDLIWMLEFFLTACLVPLTLNEAGIFFPTVLSTLSISHCRPGEAFLLVRHPLIAIPINWHAYSLLLTIKWKSTMRLVPLQGLSLCVNALLHPLSLSQTFIIIPVYEHVFCCA